MGSESGQKKVGRVNRPRVHIIYEVETGGAPEKIELPFVVGVMSDLSGMPKEALPNLKDRKFTNISHENFNDVLAKAAPRLSYRVDNKLTDDGSKMNVELNFKKFEDFEPAKVAEQVPALKELMDMRHKLAQLKANLSGNDKLESMLNDIISNTQQASALAQALDTEAPKTEGDS